MVGWWDGKGRCPNPPTTGGWQGAKRRGKRGGQLVHPLQDPKGTPCRNRGGGVHLDEGVLRLPHLVSAHGIEELVKGGKLRGHIQTFQGGDLAAEFPPQICGPRLPPKIGVADGGAQVDVNHIGGGDEGCCPAHNIVHPQCPRLVRRLLQLEVADGEGLVVGEGVGSGIARDCRLAS